MDLFFKTIIKMPEKNDTNESVTKPVEAKTTHDTSVLDRKFKSLRQEGRVALLVIN